MEERAKRKLTAILSADVKGYSRLMGEDEKATVETLKTYREVLGELIRQYRGRVVDSPGDNVLSEFASVVDAVECAVKIQEELKTRNEGLPENRRMEFRIGVHHGDVIEDEERIYGDGVNVAARIEGLAEGGGICISRTSFDSVKNKLNLGYEYLGDHSVKNIAEPVRVYKVLMEAEYAGKVIGEERLRRRQWRWAAIGGVAVLIIVIGALAIWNSYFRPAFEPASVERMAFPLPDKPSIAVLPFVNMSGDPEQEYFSDGLTEQIISTLSKSRNLFVIARNSTFTYKGKPVKVQKVAEDLGVKYVLEGSVKRSADQIRITAQLIDATTGHHVWSEHYDREPKDIFAIQDDITMEITNALGIALIEGEQARIWGKQDTTNLKAYEKMLEGRRFSNMGTKENNIRARQLFEEAIALDPGYARAYAAVGWTHFFDARFGWTESRSESIKTAFRYGQQAITLDEALDMAYSLLAVIYLLQGQHEKGISEAKRSIALNPSSADSYSALAGIVGCSGRWEDSIAVIKKAIRLNPFPPVYYFHWLGRAYFMTGQYEDAIRTWKRVLRMNPNYLPAHAFLSATYISLGRETEAVAAVEEVLRINSKFSLMSYAKTLPYRNKSDIERYMAALRKAGLPKTPPLPLPDKPSIAVLPFVNMSGDPEQEYFSDGLTDEIITALSKSPRLFVIARESVFSYKAKHARVQQVGRELGVRYVLEGGVRKSEDRVRITAQLIDALTEKHLWAERYDRPLGEIFAVQDEITLAIVKAMKVSLTDGEQARLIGKGTKNLDAYLKAIQAQEQFFLMNRQGSMKAKEFAKEAIALDPKYAFPYTTLANAHMLDAWFKFSKSPRESMRLAADAAQKALALDDSDPIIYSTLTNLYVMQRQYDKAIASAERDLELSPGGGRAHLSMGIALFFSCRFGESITFFEQAIRLNPYPPDGHIRFLGSAYRSVGRYDEALSAYKKALQLNPNNIFTHLSLASVYVSLGRMQDARAEAKEVLRIHPKFSLDHLAKTLSFKDQSVIDEFVARLREAGLK